MALSKRLRKLVGMCLEVGFTKDELMLLVDNPELATRIYRKKIDKL